MKKKTKRILHQNDKRVAIKLISVKLRGSWCDWNFLQFRQCFFLSRRNLVCHSLSKTITRKKNMLTICSSNLFNRNISQLNRWRNPIPRSPKHCNVIYKLLLNSLSLNRVFATTTTYSYQAGAKIWIHFVKFLTLLLLYYYCSWRYWF